MNIGNRPTVDGTGTSMEVHIFDFSDDIYGENLKVEILEFISDEKKFENIKDLIGQIELYCEIARKFLNGKI